MMWRRNKLYSKRINMSTTIVIGLLTILLATQSSNGQADRNPSATITNCQEERFPSMAVAECQVGENPTVESLNDKVDQIPAVEVVDNQVSRISPVAQAESLSGSWISELFYQALVNFTVRHVGSSACRAQSDMYDRHLKNHTSWAVRSEYSL